jgi:hypothetical protein
MQSRADNERNGRAEMIFSLQEPRVLHEVVGQKDKSLYAVENGAAGVRTRQGVCRCAKRARQIAGFVHDEFVRTR